MSWGLSVLGSKCAKGLNEKGSKCSEGLNERGLSVLWVYLSWVYVSSGSKWRGLSVQESKCSGPKFLGSKCSWGLNVWEPIWLMVISVLDCQCEMILPLVLK